MMVDGGINANSRHTCSKSYTLKTVVIGLGKFFSFFGKWWWMEEFMLIISIPVQTHTLKKKQAKKPQQQM